MNANPDTRMNYSNWISTLDPLVHKSAVKAARANRTSWEGQRGPSGGGITDDGNETKSPEEAQTNNKVFTKHVKRFQFSGVYI